MSAFSYTQEYTFNHAFRASPKNQSLHMWADGLIASVAKSYDFISLHICKMWINSLRFFFAIIFAFVSPIKRHPYRAHYRLHNAQSTLFCFISSALLFETSIAYCMAGISTSSNAAKLKICYREYSNIKRTIERN